MALTLRGCGLTLQSCVSLHSGRLPWKPLLHLSEWEKREGRGRGGVEREGEEQRGREKEKGGEEQEQIFGL